MTISAGFFFVFEIQLVVRLVGDTHEHLLMTAVASPFVDSASASRRQSTTLGGEVVDTRRVISKIHQLAMDPRNRTFIAKDAGVRFSDVDSVSFS